MNSVPLKSKSQEQFERAKKIFPGGVNSPVRAFEPAPFFVSCSKGSKIHSEDGDSFIDYCMAYGALLFGHTNKEILNAVELQMRKGSLYGAPTTLETEFAESIQSFFPSMERLRLVSTGTEATMHAIRVARGFTSKNMIIKFEGCFHGSHDSVLVKAGSGATTFGAPNSQGVPEETARNTIVLPYNNPTLLADTIERGKDEIAAVIVEPVMGNAGLILPQKDYLSDLRKVTSQYGVLLIFDEIITGFRLAPGGAQEYYNVKPDLTTLGKILGGGLPVAAFGGREEIIDNISPVGKVYQAGTFSGNPISASAGSAVLRILRRDKAKIYPELEKKCKELSKALADLASNFHVEAKIQTIASMFQIFFTSHHVVDYESAKTSDLNRFQAYFHSLLKQGIFIPPAQFETCFLSTAHDEAELDSSIKSFERALKAVSQVVSKT